MPSRLVIDAKLFLCLTKFFSSSSRWRATERVQPLGLPLQCMISADFPLRPPHLAMASVPTRKNMSWDIRYSTVYGYTRCALIQGAASHFDISMCRVDLWASIVT
jgi:hypothetical protein